MKKLLNRILKLVGINVVKAKRTRVKRAGYRSHVPLEDAKTDARPRKNICGSIPVGDECVNDFNAENAGHTHYVGDCCPGGHSEPSRSTGGGMSSHVDASPTQDNNVTGPTS